MLSSQHAPLRRPKRKKYLEENFVVDKIIARRRSRQGLEYLVAWEGYYEFGDTWELPGGLPPSEIAKFEAFRKPMPSSIELVLTTMRDKIARKLLPKSGPLFGTLTQRLIFLGKEWALHLSLNVTLKTVRSLG